MISSKIFQEGIMRNSVEGLSNIEEYSDGLPVGSTVESVMN